MMKRWILLSLLLLAGMAESATVTVYYNNGNDRDGRLNTILAGTEIPLANAAEQTCSTTTTGIGRNRLVVPFEVTTAAHIPSGATITGATLVLSVVGASHTSGVLGVKEITTGVDNPTETTFNASAVTGSELDTGALSGNGAQTISLDVGTATVFPTTMDASTVSPEFLVYWSSGSGQASITTNTASATRIYLAVSYSGDAPTPTPTGTLTPTPTGTATPTPTSSPTLTPTPTVTPTHSPLPTGVPMLVSRFPGDSSPENAVFVDTSDDGVTIGDLTVTDTTLTTATITNADIANATVTGDLVASGTATVAYAEITSASVASASATRIEGTDADYVTVTASTVLNATNIVAIDASGILIEDDGGNDAITVADGGAVEINAGQVDVDTVMNGSSIEAFFLDGLDGSLDLDSTAAEIMSWTRTDATHGNVWNTLIGTVGSLANKSLYHQPETDADWGIVNQSGGVTLWADNDVNDLRLPNGELYVGGTFAQWAGDNDCRVYGNSGSNTMAFGSSTNTNAMEVNTLTGAVTMDGGITSAGVIISSRGTGGNKRVYGDSADWVADNLASGGTFLFKNSGATTVWTIDNDGDCTAARSLTAGTYYQGGTTTLAADTASETFVGTHDVILVTATRATGSECTFAAAPSAGRIITVVLVSASTDYIEITDATYQDVPSTRTLYAGDTWQGISDGSKVRELTYTDNTP